MAIFGWIVLLMLALALLAQAALCAVGASDRPARYAWPMAAIAAALIAACAFTFPF